MKYDMFITALSMETVSDRAEDGITLYNMTIAEAEQVIQIINKHNALNIYLTPSDKGVR